MDDLQKQNEQQIGLLKTELVIVNNRIDSLLESVEKLSVDKITTPSEGVETNSYVVSNIRKAGKYAKKMYSFAMMQLILPIVFVILYFVLINYAIDRKQVRYDSTGNIIGRYDDNSIAGQLAVAESEIRIQSMLYLIAGAIELILFISFLINFRSFFKYLLDVDKKIK